MLWLGSVILVILGIAMAIRLKIRGAWRRCAEMMGGTLIHPGMIDGIVFRAYTLRAKQGTSAVSVSSIDVASPMELNPGIGPLRGLWDLLFGANVTCSMRIRITPKKAIAPSDFRGSGLRVGPSGSPLSPISRSVTGRGASQHKLARLENSWPVKAVNGCLELDLRGPMLNAQPILDLVGQMVDACEVVNPSSYAAVPRPQNFAEVERENRRHWEYSDDLQPALGQTKPGSR